MHLAYPFSISPSGQEELAPHFYHSARHHPHSLSFLTTPPPPCPSPSPLKRPRDQRFGRAHSLSLPLLPCPAGATPSAPTGISPLCNGSVTPAHPTVMGTPAPFFSVPISGFSLSEIHFLFSVFPPVVIIFPIFCQSIGFWPVWCFHSILFFPTSCPPFLCQQVRFTLNSVS